MGLLQKFTEEKKKRSASKRRRLDSSEIDEFVDLRLFTKQRFQKIIEKVQDLQMEYPKRFNITDDYSATDKIKVYQKMIEIFGLAIAHKNKPEFSAEDAFEMLGDLMIADIIESLQVGASLDEFSKDVMKYIAEIVEEVYKKRIEITLPYEFKDLMNELDTTKAIKAWCYSLKNNLTLQNAYTNQFETNREIQRKKEKKIMAQGYMVAKRKDRKEQRINPTDESLNVEKEKQELESNGKTG